jgi:hypothetical protein
MVRNPSASVPKRSEETVALSLQSVDPCPYCIDEQEIVVCRLSTGEFRDGQLLLYHSGMSLTLPSQLVESLPHLSAGAIKTYLALATLKAAVTDYPTQDQIAAYMSASSRSVQTYLKELAAAGYVEKRPMGAGRKTDYMLVAEQRYGA